VKGLSSSHIPVMIKLLRIFWFTANIGICCSTAAQPYIQEWILQLGGEGWDLSGAMDNDTSGNIYMGGVFSGTVTFGDHTLISNDGQDHFICKINEAGSIVGVRQVSGGIYNTLNGIHCTGNRVYLTGTFRDSLLLHPFCSESQKRTSIYVAMLDPDLEPVWLTVPVSGDKINLLSCKGDREGNCYVSGYFKKWISIEDSIVHSVNRKDQFVLKLNSEGDVDWIRTWRIKNPDDQLFLQVSAGKELIVAGTYETKFETKDTTIFSFGRKDIFIRKFDSTGNELWIKRIGGDFDDKARAIAIDTAGYVYFSGSFNHSIILQDTVYVSHGEQDLFLVKMNPSGDIIWTKHWGGKQSDEINGISIDSSGNLFTLGSFRGTTIMDQDTISSFDRQSDILFLKFDRTGECLWWKIFFGTSEDLGHTILTDYSDKICLMGSFTDDLATDQEPIFSRGIKDIFITMFIDPCTIIPFNLPDTRVLCENSYDTLDAGAGFMEYNWNNGAGDNQYFEISEPGDYFIKVTDQFGCKKSDSIHVLLDSIRIAFQVTDEFLPDGKNGSIHTSVSGISDHFSYLWNTGDTTPSLANLVQGNYSLFVSDSFGCSSFVEIPVGLDVSSGILSLSNFPNPFIETTNILYSIPDDMWIDISLFDMNGKKLLTIVKSEEKSGIHQMEWNRKDLPSGVYYLQIRVTDSVLSRKIVITDQ